jgi:hypothetical protein
MKLEPLEPCIERALRRRGEIALHARDVAVAHAPRRLPKFGAAEGQRGGADDRPAMGSIVGEVIVALPWRVCAGLAAGMADLDARNRAGRLDRGRGRGGSGVA